MKLIDQLIRTNPKISGLRLISILSKTKGYLSGREIMKECKMNYYTLQKIVKPLFEQQMILTQANMWKTGRGKVQMSKGLKYALNRDNRAIKLLETEI